MYIIILQKLIGYCKVLKIEKHSGLEVIEFVYDAMGNRVKKKVGIENPPESGLYDYTYTFYMREANGQVVAIYEDRASECSEFRDLALAEWPIYGSESQGRIGRRKGHPVDHLKTIFYNGDPASAFVTHSHYERNVRLKEFEQADHLGNVRLVFTDMKLYDPNTGNNSLDIVAANHYYPFGMLMPEASWSAGNYRWGFQGQEKDDEVKGTGNHISFNDYGYDTRLAQRYSLDPKFRDYPYQSPYSTFNSNPIVFEDPTGESGEITIDKNSRTLTISSKLMFYGNSANSELAKQSATDIQNAWNEAAGKVTIKGVEYNIKFEISGSYMPDLTASDLTSNNDIKNNYIRVEDSGEPISYYHINGNTGLFLTNNISKEGSTTEPHEYGHGIGLWPGTADGHPANTDLRGNSSPPGIMYPRGTAVDAPFTWNPENGATNIDPIKGTRTNTMNPESRKVNQTDINMLSLDKLKFINGKADLGRLTNIYIPNNTGKPDVSPIGPRKPDGSF